MKEERKSNAKYKRLSIQGKTNKEVDREICGTIYNRESSIKKYSKVETTDFNEDSSGS